MQRMALCGLLAVVLASPVKAQEMNGLFTGEGVEVRADPRLFTLFAALNGLGYDHEQRRSPAPVEAPRYATLRAEVRHALLTKPADLAALQSYLDKRPGPMGALVTRCLSLGAPPEFTAPADDPDAAALGGALQKFYAARGGDLLEQQRAGLYDQSRQVVAAIDALTAKVKQTLRPAPANADDDEPEVEEGGPRLVVLVNPLDSHGAVYGAVLGDARYLVVGPAAAVNEGAFDSLALDLTFALVRPEVARWFKKLDKATQEKAIPNGTPDLQTWPDRGELTTQLLAHQLAPQVVGRPLKLPQGTRKPETLWLTKIAETAATWYLAQQEPLPALSEALVMRTLGQKLSDRLKLLGTPAAPASRPAETPKP